MRLTDLLSGWGSRHGNVYDGGGRGEEDEITPSERGFTLGSRDGSLPEDLAVREYTGTTGRDVGGRDSDLGLGPGCS